MFEITPALWVVLAAYAFFVAVSKTGIPGVGILVVILLLFTMPAKASVGFLLPILIAGDIFAVAYYRRHAVWSHIIRLAPWAAAGVLIGYGALGHVTDSQLRQIIGAVVLVLLGIETWRNSRPNTPVPTQWWFGAMIGILAGFTTMMANAAGPLIAIYFLAMRLEKHEFIGTQAWYFLLLNCFKVPFMWDRQMITPETLRANFFLLPAVALGAVAGILVFKRIPQRGFVLTVKVLTLTAALWLLCSDPIVAVLGLKKG